MILSFILGLMGLGFFALFMYGTGIISLLFGIVALIFVVLALGITTVLLFN